MLQVWLVSYYWKLVLVVCCNSLFGCEKIKFNERMKKGLIIFLFCFLKNYNSF